MNARHFFSKNHLKSNENCNACGFKKHRLSIFNKYFEESYLKSLALFFYSQNIIKFSQIIIYQLSQLLIFINQN